MFLQLWHTGRSSHSSFQPNGELPAAPSAIAIEGHSALTPEWKRGPYETPRALELAKITKLIESYREGGRNAMAAGFDGVEVHGANGYLIEQFLHSRSNGRTDSYGGSIENRARLLLEVTVALIEIWGADRVGVRLSPFGTYNDVGDDDPIALYIYVLTQLGELDIAYAHLIEARDGAGMEIDAPQAVDQLRPFWHKTLILAGGFTAESADDAIRSGRADAVAFGRQFIANPDLPHRLKVGASLNAYNRSTFYGGGVRRLHRLSSAGDGTRSRVTAGPEQGPWLASQQQFPMTQEYRMHLALLASTGRAGRTILDELVRRGHHVTAVARKLDKLPEGLPETVTAVQDDLTSIDRIAEIIRGADAVVSAFGPSSSDPRYSTDISYTDQLVSVTERLIAAVREADAPRLIVVGGAGSLEFSPGVTVLKSGYWPEPYVNIATSHTKAFAALRASDINWTYFSPPMLITPGERTGQFRLGGDSLIKDAEGKSQISFEDYAVALVDELEQPAHERARFTVGY